MELLVRRKTNLSTPCKESHHAILQRDKRSGYTEMDLVQSLGAYCKGEAQREWQQFMEKNTGDSQTSDIRNSWRDYYADMFYHRMQGRHEKLTPPVKPTFDEPHELVEFIQRIKERFVHLRRNTSTNWIILQLHQQTP